MAIKIINATPGNSTTECILELVQIYNTGITIRELSKHLNRPVSMIQICLRKLIASKQIYVRQSKTNLNLIYYPEQD